MSMADAGELLVWPWTAILATATQDDGTLALHAQHHPAAVVTTALQEEDHHHSLSFLVLHFGISWAGLRGAMSLTDRFAGAGRREWRQQQWLRKSAGAVVYGWVAGVEDLHGDDAVGRFLRETGAVARSAEDVFGRDDDDGSDAVAKLAGVAGEYERRAAFLESKCEEMAAVARMVEEETSSLHDELIELRNIVDNILPELNHDVDEENRKLKAELDATATDEIASKIMQCKDGGRANLEKGALEINSLELSSRECRLRDRALSLHENHKQEMDAIYAKVNQLEKQLEQREALELTMRHLNMKLQAGEKLSKEDHLHLYAIMVCLRKILHEEQERLKGSCLNLFEREQMNSQELQENRRELIQGLENTLVSGRATVGIKRMGELDQRPFQLACKRKYRDEDPEGKAASLVSSWQEEINEPSWHPFTIIQVDGEDKEIIDEDDPKLKQLQIEYGDSVCNAVKVALSELHEYNPDGRQVMNELWTFREARKATMAEVVGYILEQLAVPDREFQG